MMTDPIKPLGLSFYLLTTPAPMRDAGGRLYVDVTNQLSSPASRNMLLNVMGKHDPLMKDALMKVIERGDFLKSLPNNQNALSPTKGNTDLLEQIENNPSIVSDLINRYQASIEELKLNIQKKKGLDLFDFIQEDIGRLKQILFHPQSSSVIRAAMNAPSWINEKMNEWLGEKNAADFLSQVCPQ